MKRIALVLMMVVFLATSAFSADIKPKSIKEDLKVTWVEGNGKKDGYIEVVTRSGDVYRIWPCGEVKKLTWKEIAPNTEVTTQANQIFYYNGDGAIWSDALNKSTITR